MEGKIQPNILIVARLILKGAMEMSGLKKWTNVGRNKYMYSSTFPIHCQTLLESSWLLDYIPQSKQNTIQDCKLWMPHC